MRMTSFNHHLLEYMELVKKETIKTCEEQKLLVSYVRRVFETENLRIDDEQVEKYFSYQKYFPFDLLPWEKFCFVLHCCVFKKDGRPRWPELLLYMGRGNGKNGYLSFEDWCLLSPTHGIPYYDIDISSTSEEQSKITFEELYNILEYSGEHRQKFRKNFYWTKEEIKNRKTRSKLKFRTNNPKGKDSLRSGKIDFDEIHAYQNWDNIEVFTSGLGKKPHPRITYTTTDGDIREGPLDELLNRSMAILKGEKEDNGLLPFIARLNDPADVDDESMWEAANPSIRYMPDLYDEIKRKYALYKENPVIHRSFMTKRMNCPQGRKDIEVASWEDILLTNRDIPDLEGRSCVCGLDYMKTTDFLSAFLLFRIGEIRYGIHHSWFCTRSKDRERIKISLDQMVERKLLTMVDDVEIHPHYVTDWIEEQGKKYDIQKIAIDSYRYTLMSRELKSIGFDGKDKEKVKLVRPSDIMLIVPTVNSLFINNLIIWGDDPLMRWFTNNTKLEDAPNNNQKYGKIEPKSRKTDGFMAFAASITIEDMVEDKPSPEFLSVIIC